MLNHRLLLAMVSLIGAPVPTVGQNTSPLKLVQKIPLPNVQDRLDHLGVDVKGQRLFLAALGERQNTVEVIDLKSNRRKLSISGQSKPQGVFYSPDVNKLYVANGTDGTCKIFAGDTFKLVDSVAIGTDADHVGYDSETKYRYVGIGDAKSGALSVIDTRTNKHQEDIKTVARPGGIKFDPSSPRIFVTLAGTDKLGVVDRKKCEQITAWSVAGMPGNVALALDKKHPRVFAASRTPAILTVLDTESGKTITQLEGVPGIDEVWYETARQHIHASGGRGFDAGSVYVYQQNGADQYRLAEKVPTASAAGTSLWVEEFSRFYVAAPASEKQGHKS
jgi:DNA-binding beta-propeller fold protein YncE